MELTQQEREELGVLLEELSKMIEEAERDIEKRRRKRRLWDCFFIPLYVILWLSLLALVIWDYFT